MKKILKEYNSKSNKLFGDQNNSVKIPPDGTHEGQSGWQSANAYDIFNSPGTPVYSINSGVVKLLEDYGRYRYVNGKKLYGIKLTIDGDNSSPDVYYAHLENALVKNGQNVTCGQLLGFIKLCPPEVGDSKNSHVHIGIERGSITAFLNNDGSIKCSGGSTGSSTGGSTNNDNGSTTPVTTSNSKFDIDMGNHADTNFLNTAKNFVNKRFNQGSLTSSITNRPIIKESYGDTNYLRFCNISKLLITDGQKVEKNTKLGQTSNEVQVSKYNSYKSNLKLDKSSLIGNNLRVKNSEKIIIPGIYNDYIKSPVSGIVYTGGTILGCPNKIEIEFYNNERKNKEDDYYRSSRSRGGLNIDTGRKPDPLIANIASIPYNFFKDKKDKKGFGWPGENVAPLDYFDPEYYKKESVDKNIDRIIEIINYRKDII